MLMENVHTFSQTSRSGVPTGPGEEAWKAYSSLVLEATRMYANMLATGGVYMIKYNIGVTDCTTTLSNCAFTFGRALRSTNAPFHLLQQSNTYTKDCLNALHQYNEKLTRLTKNVMDDIVMPVRIDAILAYGVIR